MIIIIVILSEDLGTSVLQYACTRCPIFRLRNRFIMIIDNNTGYNNNIIITQQCLSLFARLGSLIRRQGSRDSG